MKSCVENVDNCCGNYSHFYSLFIEKRVKNGEEKGRIVEKKGKSTTTFQKLWITFWVFIERRAKKQEKYNKIGKNHQKLWINTPFFAHSEISKV